MSHKRILFVLLIAALVVPALAIQPSVSAQEGPKPEAVGLRPDAPPYALHGPYWVGTREFVVEPDSERPLPLTVWYPAVSDTPEGSYTYMEEMPPVTVTGQAISDAAPDVDNGPYPLVLFSHAAGSFRYQSVYFTEHLASYGFVVMAPDHTGDTMVNTEDEGVYVRSHVTRPVDITRVIDFADTATKAGGVLENVIDIDRVAVTGHSSGAWTAFLAAGAQRDYRALNAWCAENQDDYWTCGNLLGQEGTIAELLGLDTVPEGLWPAVGDPRVDAIVPMGPGNATAFGSEGLAAIKVPTLIMIGDHDMFLPYDSFGPPTYEAISGQPKALVTFEGGNHMLFDTACSAAPWLVEWGLFVACSDPVWDMDRAHDLINHFTTAFLLAVLKGDAEAAAALAPDAVSFPGIEYKTQGF
jgi:predicted dienelactone hydrolase